MFRHRHGHHGHHTFFNMFKTVAQRLSKGLAAQRWLKGGRMEAKAFSWFSGFTLSDLAIFWSLISGTKVAILSKEGFNNEMHRELL